MVFNNNKSFMTSLALIFALLGGMYWIVPAQAGTIGFGWAQRAGGVESDYGTAIALDDSGNVYSTGFVTTAPGNTDIFVNKWDGNGNFIWSNVMGGPGQDFSYAVTLDGEENVYISGSYSGTVDFDPGEGISNLTSAGYLDVFISKFDGTGNFLWAKSIGGIYPDYGNQSAVDSSGNVYLIGSYMDTVDFDPGEGVSNLISTASSIDVFISKFDSSGNFLWAKSLGGTSQEYGIGILVDESGSIFATGQFYETADFDPGEGTAYLSSTGEFDIFITKLDSSGNFVWAQQLGGSASDIGREIALDGSGNVYVVGDEATDVLVSKLDGGGNPIWTETIGGGSYDAGTGITVDGNEDVYISGGFHGTVDFDPGEGISNLTSAGSYDIFISKLNGNGNFIWAKRLGGTFDDSAGNIIADDDGNLYLTGSFSNTVDFDAGEGISNLTSAGSSDIFISKLTNVPQTYYVKWDAEGANNGTSWEDAYTDLQSALAAASSGDEIWVAEGIYSPTSGADRTASFVLEDGVSVYGGFAGGEMQRDQRDWVAHETILSGDLNADDTGFTNNGENSYHVVRGGGTDNSAVLDGFIIEGGNADVLPDFWGGGMLNDAGSPTLTNLIFRSNASAYDGGGLANLNASNTTLTNVTFSGNKAATHGGGIYNGYSSPMLTDVTLTGNKADVSGGGLIDDNGSSTLMNVTFFDNSVGPTGSGGGMYAIGASSILMDVTFDHNFTGESYNSYGSGHGGGLFLDGGNVMLTRATFSNNHANVGGGIYITTGSPILMNATFSGNYAANGGGMYADGGGSPALTNVTFNGNTADNHGGAIYNYYNTATLTNVTFFDNEATYYTGGALFNYGASPVLTNVTFSENRAPDPTNGKGGAINNLNGGVDISVARPVLRNIILWANFSPTGSQINDLGELTISDSVVQGGYSGTNILTFDPLLGALGDNGGFPQTMALEEGSPATDMGNDAHCPSIDARGVPRPQGAHCDIGAYEYIGPGSPRVTSVARQNGNPTNRATVFFLVTFSESVTGVNAADFTMTTSGMISGASIVSVSGSGATRLVGVNTGSGSGTLRLDVVDDDSIQNVDLLPLGGFGVGSGNFTGGESYDIDKTAPTVLSSVRQNPNPTARSTVFFLVTFSETVTGVDAGDFALTTNGVTGASIAGVSGSGATRTVTVNTGLHNGTLRLDVVDNDSIRDAVGIPLGGTGAANGDFTAGEEYTINKPAPRVSSITRQNSNPTNRTSVFFLVTFSESVTGVNLADFALTTTGGVSGASVASVSGSGTTRTVSVNTGSSDGTLRLDVVDDDSINNAALVPLGGTGAGNGDFLTGQVYTVDKTTPMVASITRLNPTPTNRSTVFYQVTFSESVTGVDTADFQLSTSPGITGASIVGVSGSGATRTVSINTGSGDGYLRLDLMNNLTIKDAASNTLGNSFVSAQEYQIDKTAPSVVSITRQNSNPTNRTSVFFLVTFSESVTGVDSADFALVTTGISGASVVSVSGSGTTRTVSVNTGSGDGTLGLDLTDNDTVRDTVANPLGGNGPGNGSYTTGEIYTVDKP